MIQIPLYGFELANSVRINNRRYNRDVENGSVYCGVRFFTGVDAVVRIKFIAGEPRFDTGCALGAELCWASGLLPYVRSKKEQSAFVVLPSCFCQEIRDRCVSSAVPVKLHVSGFWQQSWAAQTHSQFQVSNWSCMCDIVQVFFPFE